jgi:hypothetical protein
MVAAVKRLPMPDTDKRPGDGYFWLKPAALF